MEQATSIYPFPPSEQPPLVLRGQVRAPPVAFRFEQIEVDLTRREIRRDTGLIRVEPRVFDLLEYLIRHRDRVVLKSELLDALWGSTHVSEASLAVCVGKVRKAVGDSGRARGIIRTVHGKGYQFVERVTEIAAEDGASLEQDQAVLSELLRLAQRLDSSSIVLGVEVDHQSGEVSVVVRSA